MKDIVCSIKGRAIIDHNTDMSMPERRRRWHTRLTGSVAFFTTLLVGLILFLLPPAAARADSFARRPIVK